MGETPIYKWPLPDGPDTPDVPRDMKALGEAIESSLNGVLLGGATQPMSFAGKGRPDFPDNPAVHSPDEIAQLAAAPTGSIYTFAGDQSELDAVYGARVWRKGPTDWVCVEGDTGYRTKTITVREDPGGRTMTGDYTVRRRGDVVHARLGGVYTVTGLKQNYLYQLNGLPQNWLSADIVYTIIGTVDAHNAVHTCNVVGAGNYINFSVSANTSHIGYMRGVGVADRPWPNDAADTLPARVYFENRLAEIENDPEKAEQLQQLKDELAELTGTKPGGNDNA